MEELKDKPVVYGYSDLSPAEIPPVGELCTETACILQVTDTTDFFIGLSKNLLFADDLNDLCYKASVKFKKILVEESNVTRGTIWLGLFEDGAWYRCMALGSPSDGIVDTLFVDFGNRATMEVATELRYMSLELTKFPPAIINCTWYGAAPTPARTCQLQLLEEFIFDVIASAQHVFHDIRGIGERLIIILRTLEGAVISPTSEGIDGLEHVLPTILESREERGTPEPNILAELEAKIGQGYEHRIISETEGRTRFLEFVQVVQSVAVDQVDSSQDSEKEVNVENVNELRNNQHPGLETQELKVPTLNKQPVESEVKESTELQVIKGLIGQDETKDIDVPKSLEKDVGVKADCELLESTGIESVINDVQPTPVDQTHAAAVCASENMPTILENKENEPPVAKKPELRLPILAQAEAKDDKQTPEIPPVEVFAPIPESPTRTIQMETELTVEQRVFDKQREQYELQWMREEIAMQNARIKHQDGILEALMRQNKITFDFMLSLTKK